MKNLAAVVGDAVGGLGDDVFEGRGWWRSGEGAESRSTKISGNPHASFKHSYLDERKST